MNEELSLKEFDELVRDSSSLEPFKPTYEDIIRFHSQGTRLLIEVECYAQPLEIQILEVLQDGAIFAYGGGFMMTKNWLKTQEVTVLNIFPPKELTQRLYEMEHPPTPCKKGSLLTSSEIRQLWKDLGGPVKPLQTLLDPRFEIKKIGNKMYRVYEDGVDWKTTYASRSQAMAAIKLRQDMNKK